MPLGQLRDRGHWGARSWPEAWEHQPEDFLVPLVTDPEQADPGGGRRRRPAFVVVPRLVGDAAGHGGDCRAGWRRAWRFGLAPIVCGSGVVVGEV